MKKILGLTVAGLMVIAMVASGTWAYFSDTEASSGNSLAAGTLDLNWNEGNELGTAVFSLTNKQPGDSGQDFKLIKNVGSLTGELDVAIGTITNTESTGLTEYEQDVVGGAGVGELGAAATIAIWIDVDKSGTWNTGDIGLKNDGTIYDNPTALDYQTINSYSSKTWNPLNNGVKQMLAADEHRFYISYDIPGVTGNTIQGDSASFTVTFTLESLSAD